jgi:hypothetical protein
MILTSIAPALHLLLLLTAILTTTTATTTATTGTTTGTTTPGSPGTTTATTGTTTTTTAPLCFNTLQDRLNLQLNNDTQQIKSWMDNDNHAYRLGDVILHSGKYFDDLKSCVLHLHKNTLAAKYLETPEYQRNPLIAKDKIQNMKLFNEVLLANCVKSKTEYENHVMVHLRLGDGVYGKQKVATLRKPYPLRCYEKYLGQYNTSQYTIGLIYNNTASSIFASESKVSSTSMTTDSRTSSVAWTHTIQYINQLKAMFPNARDYDPYASPDEHFCAMVDAPVLVTGKGNEYKKSVTYRLHYISSL